MAETDIHETEDGAKPVREVAVPSASGPGTYTVREFADRWWTCTCKFFEHRQVDCKHIVRVKEDTHHAAE